jgi:hypothetical protein
MSKKSAWVLAVSLLSTLWSATAVAQATDERKAEQSFLMEEYFVFPDKAAEDFIGVDNQTLAFVEWSATPGSYWARQDVAAKNEELGARTEALWERVLPHIRGFDWVAGWHLKDPSYRPEKKKGRIRNEEFGIPPDIVADRTYPAL